MCGHALRHQTRNGHLAAPLPEEVTASDRSYTRMILYHRQSNRTTLRRLQQQPLRLAHQVEGQRQQPVPDNLAG